MKQFRKRVFWYLTAATLFPPLAWFILNLYTGIFESVDETLEILLKPALLAYIPAYLILILVIINKKLSTIFEHVQDVFTDPAPAQKALRSIPITFAIAKVFYAAGGTIIALTGSSFISEREFALGTIMGLPAIFLGSIPFFIMLNIDLEKFTHEIRLPESNSLRYLTISNKFTLSITLTIVGGLVVLLTSLLAVFKNANDDIFYDIVQKGTVLAIIILGISLYNILMTSKHFTDPIKLGLQHALKLANNDFTSKSKVISRDETGYLLRSFNLTSELIKNMVSKVVLSSDQIKNSSDTIDEVTTALNSDSQEQAAALEESAAAMEEISATVHEIYTQSKSQMEAVGKVLKDTEIMNKAMDDFVINAEQIKTEATNAIATAKKASENSGNTITGMANIEKSVNEIVSFINVINDIADQTNLLSLNASIEAARAGEEGRGFAVVAQEIGNLSNKATTATKEIKKLIEAARKFVASGSELVKELNKDISKMENVSNITSEIGNQIAEVARHQLEITKTISNEIKGLKNISEEIVNATTEHKGTTNEVSKAIDGLSSLSQRSVERSQVIFDATQILTKEAGDLQTLVEKFKV